MTKDCTPIEYCNRFMDGQPCECYPTAVICQACNKDLNEHVRCHCPWQATWRSPSGADYRKIDGEWRHFIGPDVRWQSSLRVPPLTAEILEAASGVPVLDEAQEQKCSDHPDAPHGFNRNASHNAGRYVCDCEGWVPAGVNLPDGAQR